MRLSSGGKLLRVFLVFQAERSLAQLVNEQTFSAPLT